MKFFVALSSALAADPAYRSSLLAMAQSLNASLVFLSDFSAGDARRISRAIASSDVALVDLTKLDATSVAACNEALSCDTETIVLLNPSVHTQPAFVPLDSFVQQQLGEALFVRSPQDMIAILERHWAAVTSENNATMQRALGALKTALDRRQYKPMRQLAEETRIPVRDMQRAVRRLRNEGQIEKIGTTSDSQYRWHH